MSAKKLEYILTLIAAILLVWLANQLANEYRVLWDFTEEKKYTLHSATQKVLEDLNEPVTIEVYLDGELPSNFQRFQNAIDQNLTQFTIYAGRNLQYRFTNPSVASSEQARNKYYRQLMDKGLQASNITYRAEGKQTERLVFPGAIISYRGREKVVNLLQGNRAKSPDEMLNQSIEGLEYELINAIAEIQKNQRKRIGYIMGHNEPDSLRIAGFTNAVLEKYDLFKIDLPSRRTPLTGYEAIIIGKPSSGFSRKEKFLLDQYVMNGGNLIAFIDALEVDITKVEGEGTVAFPYNLGLDDLFFKYGVRVNKDYVADVNCGTTPIVTGEVGNQPRVEFLPWPYYPIITNYTKHPLVRNLDATWFRGAATLDTVKADGIKKTPLFLTSQYTRVFTPPVMVSYNDLKEKLQPEAFTGGVHSLGYLLEGKFTSLFKNRILPSGVNKSEFREDGLDAKVILISDGDFIVNELDIDEGGPLPMGVDAYSKTTYANESFLINALDYMTDDDELMLARNREIKIRPLDRVKVQEQSTRWRWINMTVPIALIVLFGVTKAFIRKKKFS